MYVRPTATSGVSASSKVKRKRSGGTDAGSSFDVDEGAGDVSGAQTTAGSVHIQGMDALLALQQLDDHAQGRRRALGYGNNLLDHLEDLKLDLLQGRVSSDRLENIVGQLSLRVKSGHSALDKVIEDIEMRARIELAKLGHYVE